MGGEYYFHSFLKSSHSRGVARHLRFLQFGSPHSLGSQAQHIAAERSEIWVNVGYRLSVFGFIASERHKLSGNYGFKDQWLALEWIKENIEAFGGLFIEWHKLSMLIKA